MKPVHALLHAALLLMWPGLVMGQGYPTKPIRLIVPFATGGPTDIFARELGQGISSQLKQPVLVDNRGGAGGVTGTDAVAKAAPDGYTLALGSSSSLTTAPLSQSDIPYQPLKDLALIILVAELPNVLVVNNSIPANNLRELVAYLKANPGKVSYGSAGIGSGAHISGELFKADAGVNMVHVPYKGAGPAIADLLGNQVQLTILGVSVLMPHVKAGKLKAIAMPAASRLPLMPDVPTTAEGGYPKLISSSWYGLIGPVGIPIAIQQRLHDAASVTLKSPEVVEQFTKVSALPIPSASGEFRKFLAAELLKWGPVIKTLDLAE